MKLTHLSIVAAVTITGATMVSAETIGPVGMTDVQMDNVVAGSTYGDCSKKRCKGYTTYLDWTNGGGGSDKPVGPANSSRPDDAQNGFEQYRGGNSPNAYFD